MQPSGAHLLGYVRFQQTGEVTASVKKNKKNPKQSCQPETAKLRKQDDQDRGLFGIGNPA